jgi:hypothetical protein
LGYTFIQIFSVKIFHMNVWDIKCTYWLCHVYISLSICDLAVTDQIFVKSATGEFYRGYQYIIILFKITQKYLQFT